MLIKIYWMTWGLIALAAAAVFMLGVFTPLLGIVFGFLCFGMVFMGMIGVLPSMVGHNAPVKVKEPKKEPAKKEKAEIFPATAVHIR